MGDKSKIEWTDATWNPVTGCTKVSTGCQHCYAERVFQRVYPGRAFTDVQVHPDRMDQPQRWKKPRMIFVNSMSDLFHESLPRKFIGEILATIAFTPRHTFQVLTKRPERMREAMESIQASIRSYASMDPVEVPPWPIPNLWLGISAEDQATLDARARILMDTPGASVRFVSYEPALGPVDAAPYLPLCFSCMGKLKYRGPDWVCTVCGHTDQNCNGKYLDWIIAGGESGPRARLSHLQWFRDVRDQCATARVPFFMKQITFGGRKIPIERWPVDLKIREYPNAARTA